MRTAAYVIDQALDLLAESNADPTFWSRAELLVLVNDGFLEFTLYSAQLTSEATYPIISSKLQGVPRTAIALLHVSASNGVVVNRTALDQLDRENPNWEQQSGTLQNWAQCGLTKWIVDRHPTVATNVKLTTLDMPPALEEDSEIDLEPEYINGLILYVFHGARFKEGGGEFGQSMTAYDGFLSVAGLHEVKEFSEAFVLWVRDPLARTGEIYQAP